ncbi:PREDICTED: cytochrome b5-like [Dinoponera quadriceps]|uniref:Cytochrome b5-like n=1 Tax=Dinoponera quadriceps TaxID=609295 RepID=A0A6P3Y4G3_DINQU|nr:PREDICTED: cytochrome b5-like [Dinoponera quadriceps]XP_014485731.1 PREDICTED: cytochrome b5-like [Dinoponera quadriceps]
MSRIYTAEEIAREVQNGSLWIVIHNSVYDLTKFYVQHPGGEEVLFDLAGKDGSQCFDSVGHSEEAIMLRDIYKIGDLEEDASLEQPAPTAKPDKKSEPAVTQDEDWQYRKTEAKERSLMPLVATVLAIYAFIIYYVWF